MRLIGFSVKSQLSTYCFGSIRILPHQQNTGAFFVAVLQKVGAFTSREKKSEVDSAETELDSKKREFDERFFFN